jgi:hypothetical protein
MQNIKVASNLELDWMVKTKHHTKPGIVDASTYQYIVRLLS